MKKIVLFIFILSSFHSFAQMNEINISYQVTSFDNFQNHTSLSYYRTVGVNKYLGLRTNFQWFNDKSSSFTEKKYAGSIDLINRWNFSNKKKFRFWGELGISVKRQIESSPDFSNFCYCLPPLPAEANIIIEKWTKGNQLGFASALGMDYEIFKHLQVGLIFSLKKYRSNKQQELSDSNHLSSLSIIIGYKF